MNRLTYLLLLSVSAFFFAAPVAVAQSEGVSFTWNETNGKKAGQKESGKRKKAASARAADTNAVMEALSAFEVFGGRPNARAEYYIYLYTSSWCGYCQQCMPLAVQEYKKMRAKKVEMIVICGDKTEAEAKRYLKSRKLKAPAIMFEALRATNFQGLPACGMPGFPALSVVDREGKLIKNVVGATQVQEVLTQWRDYTSPAE